MMVDDVTGTGTGGGREWGRVGFGHTAAAMASLRERDEAPHSHHHSSSNSANISRNNSNNSLNSNIVVPVAQRRASKGDKDRIKGWLSTGLVPQFLHVSFFEKWEIKKVSGDDAIHY